MRPHVGDRRSADTIRRGRAAKTSAALEIELKAHRRRSAVPTRSDAPIAVLWEVEWNEHRLSCAVYRHGAGLQLRIESPTSIVTAEPFEMRPRALARAELLHRNLTRRGWRDAVRIGPDPPARSGR
jgi:hypothetical protein